MNTLDDSTFIICHVCVYVCHDVYVQVSGLPVHMGFFPSALWISEIEPGSLCLTASTFAL